jgi:hypothetical protein
MYKREIIQLNDEWEFDRTQQSEQWFNTRDIKPNIQLPHCWNQTDAFQDHVVYYRGPGSYRRVFRLDGAITDVPAKWFLESSGFYGTGTVWLNGKRISRINGNYLGFRLDVTDALSRNDTNVLGIELTNRCGKSILPGIDMPDFLLYGGLSGHIRLIREPRRYINPAELAIRYTDCDAQTTQVTIVWKVEGDGCESDTLEWTLIDPAGIEIEQSLPVHIGNQRQGMTLFTITKPKRWDVDHPHCYQALGTIRANKTVIDLHATPFGIRTAEFRPREGFFLNGRRIALRGCNRHESMPGFGRALPRWLHEKDARIIKDMGLNFVRLSHYPQHPEFLHACDRLGILVYAEIASWKSVRGGRWLKEATSQMHDMIRRDRHHPSIILWGMGNEGRHAGAYRKLYKLCKALDPQRAVTYAENHYYRAKRHHTIGIPDVWGLNYEFDALEDGIAASRLQCAVVSECSNYPHTRRGEPKAEAIQLETIQKDLAFIDKHPEIAGFSLWCLNDYATLRKQRYRRFSGIVDAWRSPKASARWLAKEGGNRSFVNANRAVPEAGQGSIITLAMGNGELSDRGDYTVEAIVYVKDNNEQLCRWNGELTATITGPARCRSFDGNGTIWVADGIGRAFVSGQTGANGRIELTISGCNLKPATLTLQDA